MRSTAFRCIALKLIGCASNENSDALSQQLYTNPHTYFDEVNWMVQQGPYAPGMFEFLRTQESEYDAMMFYTYLYPTTFFGIQYVPQKAILVSTAHDEPPLYFDIFRMMFHLPKAFLYLTEEEKALVHRTFRNEHIPHEHLGTGVDAPASPAPEAFRRSMTFPVIFCCIVVVLTKAKAVDRCSISSRAIKRRVTENYP